MGRRIPEKVSSKFKGRHRIRLGNNGVSNYSGLEAEVPSFKMDFGSKSLLNWSLGSKMEWALERGRLTYILTLYVLKLSEHQFFDFLK